MLDLLFNFLVGVHLLFYYGENCAYFELLNVLRVSESADVAQKETVVGLLWL